MASRMGPGCFAVKFTYYHTGISGAFIIQQHWLHPLSLLSAANRPFDAYWPLRWPELVESPQFQTCWLATMLHPEFRGQTFLISLSGEKRFCLLVVKLIQVCKVHDIFFRSFSRALSNVNKFGFPYFCLLSLLLNLLLYYLKELIICCTAVYYCGSVDRITCLFHPLSKWDKSLASKIQSLALLG